MINENKVFYFCKSSDVILQQFGGIWLSITFPLKESSLNGCTSPLFYMESNKHYIEKFDRWDNNQVGYMLL